MTMRSWSLLVILAAPVVARVAISDITRCQTGSDDLVGNSKYMAAQVCNLFGDTCYMNHVEDSDCASQALRIPHETCRFFPLRSYKGGDRSDPTQLEAGSFGCTYSCTNAGCIFSGGCVSVQCKTESTFAGPGMSWTGPETRNLGRDRSGITNTATQFFLQNDFASIPDEADALKTVFLSRTGNYVATVQMSQTADSRGFVFGHLPSSHTDFGLNANHGPVKCPLATAKIDASGNLKSSELMSDVVFSVDELKMCGSDDPGTNKYVDFSVINLLMDKGLLAWSSEGDCGGPDDAEDFGNKNEEAGSFVRFLGGVDDWAIHKDMAETRMFFLSDDEDAAHCKDTFWGEQCMIMTSNKIVPQHSPAIQADVAGLHRNYAVVFYCSDYARTDLTKCPAEKRKTFYVADPNPSIQFGTAATSIGGTPAADCDSVSNSFIVTPMGAVSFLGFVLAVLKQN